MEEEKTFKIVTLGCRTNQYESQGFRDQLEAVGLMQAGDGKEADICIVNTCTVTESADSSSRHEITKLLKQNPNAQVVVTGCYAERAKEKVQALSPKLKVISNADKEAIVSNLFPEASLPEFSIKRFEAHTRAFVKVQDGCNSFCTYCIIPYVRGRSRSRTIESVVDEVKGLVKEGFKEVVLTGINIGDFDGQGNGTLTDLVKAVDQVEGLKRLRLSSIDPDEVDESLQEAILSGRVTSPSLHLVLQSGSNVVLKRMNRKYTRQIFLETVDRLRRACPDFTFTTDIIVGFPGETEADFQDTLKVMEEVQFAKVHMFPYSPRERTRAALYPNQIPKEIANRRKDEVLRLAEKTAFQLRERYVSRRAQVLTEAAGSGHTDNFLQVLVQGDFPPNTLVDVELTENTPQGLIGKVY